MDLGLGVVDGRIGKKTRDVETRHTDCMIAGYMAEEGEEVHWYMCTSRTYYRLNDGSGLKNGIQSRSDHQTTPSGGKAI